MAPSRKSDTSFETFVMSLTTMFFYPDSVRLHERNSGFAAYRRWKHSATQRRQSP